MPSMGYHITPLPQSDTNWMGVGMNLGQALQTGRNNYDADQLAEANRQAGGLAAAGDLTGARNLMWSQGHPAEGTQWGNLAQAAKTHQEEAGKTALTQQVGALLAQGTPEARAQAAQMLYKAGRIVEAQALVSQGQNAQTGELERMQKLQELQKKQNMNRAVALRRALSAASTPEEYDSAHDALVASGVPEDKVAKYRDITQKDAHIAELDRIIATLGGGQSAPAAQPAKLPSGYREKYSAPGTPVLDATGRPVVEPIPGTAEAPYGNSFEERMQHPEYAGLVRDMHAGKVLPQEVASTFKGSREKLIMDVGEYGRKTGEPYSPSEATNAYKAWAEQTAGKQNPTTASGARASLNKMSEHIPGMLRDIDALDNSAFTKGNIVSNWWNKNWGGDEVGNFELSRNIAMGEAAKVITGKAETEGAQKRAAEEIPTNAGRAAQIGHAATLADKAIATANSLDMQYKQASGRYIRPLETFTPQATAGLKALVIAYKETHPGKELPENLKQFDMQEKAKGSPVQVSSPQDVEKLPPGTIFITPDGRTKVKP